jgi:hypothetical protein
MKFMAFALSILFVVVAAYADDPGDPDSVYIGNLDGSPIIVGIDEEISVPVWIKTDDSVAFVHFPLATDNLYIDERLEGEHVISYCVPNMPPGYPTGSFSFMTPDSMNQHWTNQSLVVFWGFGQRLHTQYEWCHKFNYFMRTTSDPGAMGDTAFCFMEGYNPVNGSLLFGLSDGITEVIPQVVYGALHFAVSGAEDDNLSPGKFELSGAYPNPFNASTTVEFTLPEAAHIEISVYNILGQKVAILYYGQKVAGNHAVTWDAAGTPSGIYFARLESGAVSESIKMLLLK